MSRYNSDNNPTINMKIVIGSRIDTVNVSKVTFDVVMKVPDNWEHVYELDINDDDISSLTDEDFVSICNHIGDIFLKERIEISNGTIKENVFLHVVKFIDKYVIPNIRDGHNEIDRRIHNYISECDMQFPLDTTVDIFPDTHLEYKYVDHRFHQQRYSVGISDPSSYVPTGTLQDAYVIYKLLSNNYFTLVSGLKWFKSLKLLFQYFNIDHLIDIYRSKNSLKIVETRRNISDIEEDSPKKKYIKKILPYKSLGNVSDGEISGGASGGDETPKKKYSMKVESDEDEDEIPKKTHSRKVESDDDDGSTEYKDMKREIDNADHIKILRRYPVLFSNDEKNIKMKYVMDEYNKANKPVLELLLVFLKNHINKLVLPEKEYLINSMNEFGNTF